MSYAISKTFAFSLVNRHQLHNAKDIPMSYAISKKFAFPLSTDTNFIMQLSGPGVVQ